MLKVGRTDSISVVPGNGSIISNALIVELLEIIPSIQLKIP